MKLSWSRSRSNPWCASATALLSSAGQLLHIRQHVRATAGFHPRSDSYEEIGVQATESIRNPGFQQGVGTGIDISLGEQAGICSVPSRHVLKAASRLTFVEAGRFRRRLARKLRGRGRNLLDVVDGVATAQCQSLWRA